MAGFGSLASFFPGFLKRKKDLDPAPERFRRRFSETQLREPVDTLLRWLHDGDVPPPSSHAQAAVEALERRYAVRIPEDFRRYLLSAPRFEVTDDEMTAWWTIDRVRNLPDEYEHPIDHPGIAAETATYLFFADYMVWCWAWAICCSGGPNRGRIAFIGGPVGFVADSFAEFVERYLRDPRSMANSFPDTEAGS